MILRSALSLVFASSLAFAAPVPKGKVKDAEAIQGRWHILEMTWEGAPKVNSDSLFTAVFDQGKIRVYFGGAEIELITLIYKLDVDKSHINIHDAADVDGDDIGKGIYRLEGDTLTIALSKNDEVRPKQAKAGEGVCFFKLQRLPKEKK